MSAVVDLVEPGHLVQLANPADLRLGREIARNGEVELLHAGPLNIRAKVGGGQRRTVQLTSTPRGLAWTCTCTKRPDFFCKHCVAAAVATWEEMSPAS